MFATPQDTSKIEAETMNVIKAHPLAPMIFVNTQDFLRSCKVARLQRRNFIETVNDIMSGSTFCKTVGVWMIGELGDGYSVMTKLGDPGQPGNAPAVIARQTEAGLAIEHEFDLRTPKSVFQNVKKLNMLHAAALLSISKVMIMHGVPGAAAASNRYDAERVTLMMLEGIDKVDAKAALEIDLSQLIK